MEGESKAKKQDGRESAQRKHHASGGLWTGSKMVTGSQEEIQRQEQQARTRREEARGRSKSRRKTCKIMQEVRREIQEESKRQEQDRRMRQEAKERSRENTRQEESCHARAGLWTGSKTWKNKTSCKSNKLEEASGKSKKKQQEARERSRRNPKTWNKKACRNSKKLYPCRRRFKGLGMQVGSQKATLGTRNSRPEAVSILQWHGFWLRLEGLRVQVGVQVGASFWSVQKATVGIRNSKAQGGICPSVGWCLGVAEVAFSRFGDATWL